tara:strand:+ start:101578 stop:101940 length:363 start_codon:yes stop_codon:yes gene_type:complete
MLQTLSRLKQVLTERLPIPVYLHVPQKIKRPYGILEMKQATVGKGDYEGYKIIEANLTVWCDVAHTLQIQEVLERLEELSNTVLDIEESQMHFLVGAAIEVATIKNDVIGYRVEFRGICV